MTAAETPRTDERATLSEVVEAAHAEIHRICQGGDERWRMSIPANPTRDSDLILTAALDGLTDRLAAAVARAEAAEAKVAAVKALCGDHAIFADFGEPPEEDVVPGVRESDLLAALGSATTEEAPGVGAAWGVVLDDAGSTDQYDTRDEAERAMQLHGGLYVTRITAVRVTPTTEEDR
ncbi:hypothetical protein ABKW28_12925 [Nocardioides sp. 31GB23]|uniref:hypothetical protein n=1 Tax=Nocardioides sp. 31GB23 TaxID=3156065 RepID=UPI0032AF3B48